ncbi:hypothetical protein F4778DRAFT_459020 [Xylariomycetidae sp. FL2044]|nr:hypothetical protein F4778DRAFT_459020 [Xylariomycetidae sp. FL2044]
MGRCLRSHLLPSLTLVAEVGGLAVRDTNPKVKHIYYLQLWLYDGIGIRSTKHEFHGDQHTREGRREWKLMIHNTQATFSVIGRITPGYYPEKIPTYLSTQDTYIRTYIHTYM